MQQLATLFSRTNVCNLLPVCIGLRDYDVWKLTCCSLSSQLFSSQKLSWEGVLREGSRPFFNRHGATVYMQRYQKCFSHNHERNGRTTLIVNIKRINFVGLHFFLTCIPIQGNLIFPDLSFSTTPSKIRTTKILFSISWDYISFYFHFFFKSVHKLCSYIQFVF